MDIDARLYPGSRLRGNDQGVTIFWTNSRRNQMRFSTGHFYPDNARTPDWRLLLQPNQPKGPWLDGWTPERICHACSAPLRVWAGKDLPLPTSDIPPAPAHYERLHFDLSEYDAVRDDPLRIQALNAVKAAPCTAPEQDDLQHEIIVCGSRNMKSYRLPPVVSRFSPTAASGRAELHLGNNAVVGLRAETVMIGNAASNRMMVTYNLKF